MISSSRARWCVLPLCLVLLALSSAATAQGDDAAKPLAKARLAEGNQLYDQGDYEGALRKFRAAFDLYASPKLHFNFGLAYRGLTKDVEALQSFERFLAEAPEADPAKRSEAQGYIEELRRRVATVDISSDAAGAEVFIDGKSYGLAPLAGPLLVVAGPHQVVVQKKGAPAPYTERFEAKRGGRVRIDARMPSVPAPVPAAAPTSAAEDPSLAATRRSAPEREEHPVYHRWWFWTAAGALVAGGVIAAITLSSRGTDKFACPECNVDPGVVTIPTK